MADEGKGVALTILGVVAIVAIIGLVLLFSGAKKGATGAVPAIVGSPNAVANNCPEGYHVACCEGGPNAIACPIRIGVPHPVCCFPD